MNNIDFVALVGIATVVVGTLVKLIGFPDQIRQNHKRRSTNGLSVVFISMSFVSYALWTLYGSLRADWVVILGQGLGVITTGVILWQIWLYRDTSKEPRT